jgi:hypothetical protein
VHAGAGLRMPPHVLGLDPGNGFAVLRVERARIIDLEHFLRQTGLHLRINSKGMLCRKMRACGSS